MRKAEADSVIRRLASPWGPVNHHQLITAGITEDQIRSRLHSGFLVAVGNVYGVAGYPLVWQRQYKAAELSVPGAAISQLAACHVHRFDSFPVVRPEILVPYTKNVRNKLATVHRGANALITTVDHLRVTTVAQTLFDIVPRVDLRRLERAIDDAILTKATTVEALQERRIAYDAARKPGIALWRALVDERLEDGWVPPESELEALLWTAYGLVPNAPPARRQAPAWWEPRPGRKDVMVDDWGLIVEADGRRWHARLAAFDADRWRDNVAVAHGYRIQRFTHLHLTQRLREVVGLIAAAGGVPRAKAA